MKTSCALVACGFVVALLSGCTGMREAGAPSPAKAAIAPIIVDSQAHTNRIAKEGDWQWGEGGGDWQQDTLWASQGKGEAKLSWRPDLPVSGNYRVSVWFGDDPNSDHASNAPFTVHYKGGKKEYKVDQQGATENWRDLGIHPFTAGAAGYVEISNNADGNVVADAVKFEYVPHVASVIGGLMMSLGNGLAEEQPVVQNMALCAGPENLLKNAGFDNLLDGWKPWFGHVETIEKVLRDGELARARGANGVVVEAAKIDGKNVARIVVPDGVKLAFPHISQRMPWEPGWAVEASMRARSVSVHDSHGVYLSFSFLDGDGKRLSFEQAGAVPNTGEWSMTLVRGVAPPGTKTLSVSLLCQGHGEAQFDSAILKRLALPKPKPLTGAVALDVTGEVVCDSFRGFGAQDNGWFYAPNNVSHGIEEQDFALREGRIEFMDPDWMRMFFWIKDWCPNADWENFTFDSPNMESHYRTLDLYQRIGTNVNVTGTEWTFKAPFAQPEKMALALGELFDYLINTRGYTCIKEWTLTNEPNLAFHSFGGDWSRFVELHKLVKKEFARRNLDIEIVGSDDGDGLPWFAKCVKDTEYFETVDALASHWYPNWRKLVFAPNFYRDRLELLAAALPRKPLVMAEYGFSDERMIPPCINPAMAEYPYALWTTGFVIDGLNLGVAGYQMWCLEQYWGPHDILMELGLWTFEDDRKDVFPAYHACANLSRMTEAGDKVVKCVSSHPLRVRGAVVGKTLFWVNESEDAAKVKISGFDGNQVRIMTQDNLEGDRECGLVTRLSNEGFTAPARSFGYAIAAGEAN